MHVLIILPDYYPKQNPRVYRWQAIAEHWAMFGWEVSVLCGKHAEQPRQQTLNGVEVFRAGHANMLDWLNDLTRAKSRRREVSGEIIPAQKTAPCLRILDWLHKIWAAIYWPDGSCIWVFPARRKAKVIGISAQPDVIVSVSLPFSSHLVGRYCKKRWPSAKWIIDTGDPFSIPESSQRNNLLLYRRLNKMAERRLFLSADAVCVTVDAAKEAYVKCFPEVKSKIQVIPPLCVAGSRNLCLEPLTLDKSKIHLAYFGSFYTGIRPPIAALELLGNLGPVAPGFGDTIHLHFIGFFETEFHQMFQQHEGYNHSVFVHGMVPQPAVFSYMQQFDFLLNIGNRTTCQLPSKCMDYLRSGKPIVNICLRQEDTFAAFFKGYPAICNLLYGENGFEKGDLLELVDFLKRESGKRVGREWITKQMGAFSVASVAGKYEKLF